MVNSRGGHLEQTYQYLDAQSAAAGSRWPTRAVMRRHFAPLVRSIESRPVLRRSSARSQSM